MGSKLREIELLVLASKGDEPGEKNEPAEGTPADLAEDQKEALQALLEAVDAVKEAFAEFKTQGK
jgi:hypothetical protein